ncbi:metallophosphoesterase family protein [Limosilactobacillus walteri]|uniref:DNA repair exonuclease n=1 Tax=Limosilactobacillus walteri TaxID=2268022 RepID=A0ABR8P9M2_9LACO|nr:DNA repair exonuclease [Limosilactobacillus walteri]MBD5807374.1 DNA repair exonuclease [Limosilactobacillus walteri]
MKFIHTADLHLDSPFRGLTTMPQSLWERVHSSTFNAFQRIVDDAIAAQVDFVLITGDIYDRDQQSIAAVDFFAQQCERLAKIQIPVYILYGNHDYQLVQGPAEGLPANVHVFPNRVTTMSLTLKSHETVAITGFSYDQRWLVEDQINKYPRKGNVTWQVGMLHGALHQQAQTDHYAPFTLDELRAKNYDYWALGHIHKHQVLATNPPIVYSGNPQGRHKNEGGQHGYYLVESQQNKLVPHFKPVATIEWTTITINLPRVTKLADLETSLVKQIDQKTGPLYQLITVNVKGYAGLERRLQHLLANGEVLAHLQAKTTTKYNWWIYELTIDQQTPLPSMTDLDERYWQEAAGSIFTTANILALTKGLAKESYLADQLASLDLDQMRKRTIQLLGQGGLTDED